MLAGSILDALEKAHQSGQVGKRPLNFGVYYKNTLVALCHALEDCILNCSSPPLVITAFQRGKWYLEEADRYAELAAHAEQVVILASPDTGFADHPTSQRANVALVSLEPDDAVAQEWHLMIFSSTYTAMVLCQELSVADYGAQGVPSHDLERKFYGFWTFEAGLVQETVELAIAHIQRNNPLLAVRLTAQLQAIAAQRQSAPDDLGSVVVRVVDYLHSGQAGLAPALQQDLLDRNLVSNEIQAFLRMAQLIDQADAVNPTAAAEVAALAEAVGQLLDLPAWQLNRLRLAGLLHRLSPLQQTEAILSPGQFGRYSEDQTAAPSCPLVPGAQVLRVMPRLRAIATIITHQTEHWDGSGQPAGLAGDEIPLESRILGLVADFQQRVVQKHSANDQSASIIGALEECKFASGKLWDPKLVETLALLALGLQQGLTLAVSIPKISAGLWLVDDRCGDDLLAEAGMAYEGLATP
jgi:DICT domain-containing protein